MTLIVVPHLAQAGNIALSRMHNPVVTSSVSEMEGGSQVPGNCLEGRRMQGKNSGLVRVASQTVALGVESVEARLLLAETLAKAKRHHEALLNYTLVLAIEPGHVRALLGRSRLCFEMSLYGQARKDLNTLIFKVPGNAEYHYMRARALLKLNNVRDAYRDFLKAYDLDKRYPRPKLIHEDEAVQDVGRVV
jgi:tetratricopeptide (TPR) repeat protein